MQSWTMMGERPEPYPEERARAATIRSRLMLEIASELVGEDSFEPKQTRIQFRPQGGAFWHFTFFASDALSTVDDVIGGQADFAILNPASMVNLPVQGLPPFQEPVPLRAIATIPSYDQLGVAVAHDLDVSDLTELATMDRPLRISLRGARPDHSVHRFVEDLFATLGLSAEWVEAGGGSILYQEGIPHEEPRATSIRNREVDVVIDEGIYNWVELAIGSGFGFLSIPDSVITEMETLGYRRGMIAADDYAALDEDVTTLDFSGFLIYTHESTGDDLVTRFCQAMATRSDRIPWQGGSGLPLAHMVSDAVDAPLPIPFHPAAAAVWRSLGLID